MKITTGDNAGYYYLPSPHTNDNGLVQNDTVYSRLKLKNNKLIRGFNKTYLPLINGYYYVPKINGIDTRKLIYALETKSIPSSGNTETFLRDLENTVSVPKDYCPYYLDPCKYDWCNRCYSHDNDEPTSTSTTTTNNNYTFKRYIYITIIIVIIAFFIVIAVRS